MSKIKPLEVQFNNRREFLYKKGDVSLNFTLNIDRKEQIKDFIELLKQALIDCQIVSK